MLSLLYPERYRLGLGMGAILVETLSAMAFPDAVCLSTSLSV
jgi:hypothetical protein